MKGFLKPYASNSSKDGLSLVITSLALAGAVPAVSGFCSGVAASTENLLTVVVDPYSKTVWGSDETCDKQAGNALSALPQGVLAMDGDGLWSLFSSTEGYPAGVCDSVVGTTMSREQAIQALSERPEEDFFFIWSQEDDGITVVKVENRSTATSAIDALMATATTGPHFKCSFEGVTEGRSPIGLSAET